MNVSYTFGSLGSMLPACAAAKQEAPSIAEKPDRTIRDPSRPRKQIRQGNAQDNTAHT